MTKSLTKEEKQQRKQERRNSRQQRQASPTVRTVTQPKPNPTANLCDGCVYEYGECDGQPKFASDFDASLKGAAADVVVECAAHKPVDDVPPDYGQAGAPGRGAAGTLVIVNLKDATYSLIEGQIKAKKITSEEAEDLQRRFIERTLPFAELKITDDPFALNGIELEEEPGPDEEAQEPKQVKAEPIQRGAIDRFANDEIEYGLCPSCETKLKRTAYSRYVDAVRCTNPRCRAYRAIIKTVPTGAK